jgi:hypothetical protein
VVADLTVQLSDAVPPAPPVLLSVANVGEDSVRVRWKGNSEPDLAGYRLSFTLNGLTWVVKADEAALGPSATSVTYPIGQNQAVYFRLVAVDAASPPNLSTPSDIYGIRLAPGRRTLIVDGFDRTEGSGSYHFPDHPFAMTHGRSIRGWFTTCANDALLDGSSTLAGHDRVVWILGDESAADQTFDDQEQALVKSYLDLTGKGMMISGSEVAYDLDRTSGPTTADREFLHSYLKLAFVDDKAGIFDVGGVPASPFEGISFRYGIVAEGSPYEEDWPDVFAPLNGGEALLGYGQSGSAVAAVGYRGPSPGGGSSAVVTLGFPFETITTQGARDTLMDRVMTYLDGISALGEQARTGVPGSYELFQNYPNPFNPSTSIRYVLPEPGEVRLVVYDVLGREVATLVGEHRQAGMHTAQFDASHLGSGVYYAVLSAGGYRYVRSMVLVK